MHADALRSNDEHPDGDRKIDSLETPRSKSVWHPETAAIESHRRTLDLVSGPIHDRIFLIGVDLVHLWLTIISFPELTVFSRQILRRALEWRTRRLAIVTTLSISLPDEMKAYVEAETAREGYASVSEYLCAVIRDAQNRRAKHELEAKLVEGLQSPASDMTDADWNASRARVRKKSRKVRSDE
jgi:antitoxin ParD1/3/4